MYSRLAIHSHPMRWQRFGLDSAVIEDAPVYRRYNIGPVDNRHPERWADSWLPIIEKRDGRRVLSHVVWGPLIKRGSGRMHRFCKTRLEHLPRSSLWRDAWSEERRGIVPADGFFVWRTPGGRHQKRPYFVRRRDREPLALAALYGTAPVIPEGEPMPVCVLVTRHAAGEVARIHYRMPAEVPEHLWEDWLAGGHLRPATLAATDPAAEWEWWRVSPAVNDPEADGPELIEPVSTGI